MRHVLLVLVLAVSALDIVGAQFMLRRASSVSDPPPVVLIDTPTPDANLTTTDGTLPLGGTYADPAGGVVSMSATCATCTDTTPDIVFADGRWVIGGGTSSATVIGQDNFSVSTNTNLTAYTGTFIDGTGAAPAWTEREDTCVGGIIASVRNAEQAVSPNATGGNCYATYTWQLAAAFAGPNYYYQFTNKNTSAPGSDDGFGLLFGRNPANEDECALRVLPGYLQVLKRNGGTPTSIASMARSNVANDIYRVHVNASAIKVYANDMVTPVIDTTDTFCDDNYGAHSTGIVFGDIAETGTDDPHTFMRMDDIIATDLGTAGSGLAFAVGTHPITVCATDSGAQTACDTITVTRTASDTTDPTIAFQTPSGPTSTQITAPFTSAGIANDNVLVSSVACTCATCSDTTPNVTFSAPGWSTASVNLSSGDNTIICTATDSSARTAQASHTVTYNPTDTTRPTVDIQTPSASGTYNNGTGGTVTIGGIAADNVGGSGLASVTWVNSLGTSGTATGTDTWSAVVSLAVGVNTITVTARDVAGNTNLTAETIAVTRSASTMSVLTTNLPTIIEDTTNMSFQIQATGGTPPYTCALQSGTLPANIILTGATCTLSGIATTAGVTSGLVFRVTDSTPTTPLMADSSALTLTVNAAGSEGPNDWYTAALKNTYLWAGRHATYRSQAVIDQFGLGEFLDGHSRWVTYDPTFDAAKITIPPFSAQKSSADPTNITAQMEIGATTYTIPYSVEHCNAHKVGGNSHVRLDSEIMPVVTRVCTPGVNIVVTVTRGAFGTTPAVHTAGTALFHSNNDLQSESWIPLGTSDGNTYLFVWDSRLGPNYIGLTDATSAVYTSNVMTNNKYLQFNSNGIWWEVQQGYNGVFCTGYNKATHVHAIQTRTYNQVNATITNWADTNGLMRHPASNQANNQVGPYTTTHCLSANKWVRYFVRVTQRASDWDDMSMWIWEEGGSLKRIFTDLKYSMEGTPNNIQAWWLELDTSVEKYRCKTSTCPNLEQWIRNMASFVNVGDASSGPMSDANIQAAFDFSEPIR